MTKNFHSEIEIDIISNELGGDIPIELLNLLIEAVIPTAEQKLERVINRYGDLNGERRKPYYISMLIAELIRSEAMFSRNK